MNNPHSYFHMQAPFFACKHDRQAGSRLLSLRLTTDFAVRLYVVDIVPDILSCHESDHFGQTMVHRFWSINTPEMRSLCRPVPQPSNNEKIKPPSDEQPGPEIG